MPAAELDAIAANLQPRLRTFGPQASGAERHAVWCTQLRSCASLPHLWTVVKVELVKIPFPRSTHLFLQSLSNIAWAYTTLGHCPPPPFLQVLGDAALPQLAAFEPQGLSLLVWSLSSLGCRHTKLFHA